MPDILINNSLRQLLFVSKLVSSFNPEKQHHGKGTFISVFQGEMYRQGKKIIDLFNITELLNSCAGIENSSPD